MKETFIKVASATSDVTLGNIEANVVSIKKRIEEADALKVKILCFQELCITGYSLMDLFHQDAILKESLKALIELKKFSSKFDMFIVVSLPIEFKSKVYDASCSLFKGKILGIQLKTFLPNYQEFYDMRYFTPSFDGNSKITIDGDEIPIGNKLLFTAINFPGLTIGIEICEDMWAPISIGTNHALNGATVILNPSASNELISKDEVRRTLIKAASEKLICAYIYANAGFGETSQDVCYSGHGVIAENGRILTEINDLDNHLIYSDINIASLNYKRRKNTTFKTISSADYQTVPFSFADTENKMTSPVSTTPYLLDDSDKSLLRILDLQVASLKKRLSFLNITDVVLGLSGGLDSTLALLVCYFTFKEMKLDTSGIHAFSMPCFATSTRTKSNAEKLASSLKVSFKEIDITSVVKEQLKLINHDFTTFDTAYENVQARERTSILMNYSNSCKGIVIGTSDLSEIALGWSTYNGDQMSMYNPNGSLYKTVIQKEVKAISVNKFSGDENIQAILLDIIATPISPELVPDKNIQSSENILGPYEIHDFVLYHFLNEGLDFSSIYELAVLAFKDKYSNSLIKKTIETFIKRFFRNQFKRNPSPDSVKILDVSLSPRSDYRQASDYSDADFKKWFK